MMKKLQKNNSDILPSPLEKRNAGLLLHITSLPGPYGIGDLGHEAMDFVDLLEKSGQTYWQILPLNPTGKGAGHSPYSSVSSMAGNPLLISPDWFVENGYIEKRELEKWEVPSREQVNFDHAEVFKDELFHSAFTRFMRKKSVRMKNDFMLFCKKEKYWLDDFASYILLKNHFNQKPWYEWPDEYRLREPRAIGKFNRENEDHFLKVKWIQYIFFLQWQELKEYGNKKGIQFLGDLPIYVSYDSADVWSDPGIFSINKKSKMEFVAGVPPDYFNADGQLWGMPVFRWDVLKKQDYDWWIKRLKKNVELFNLVRLDHFRAFADYWAVPASEKTARNGSWKRGPGEEFFLFVKNKFRKLPFVAEDLGDINDAVYDLRDTFNLPGMKVLQFAFSENMPESDYIPHNYQENFVVYTGTHDNNTTCGWYNHDAGETERTNLKKIIHEKITGRNVHLALIRMAYQSVAKTAIIPVQDVLGLDEKSRMNSPASAKGNWLWRLLPDGLTAESVTWLRDQTKLFNR